MPSKSSTTTKRVVPATAPIPPVHPGEILGEEFLRLLGLTQYRLATDIKVPPRRINEIIHGKRGISADTALRLARYFGTSERFWLNLQSRYDLELAKSKLGTKLESEVPSRPFARADDVSRHSLWPRDAIDRGIDLGSRRKR